MKILSMFCVDPLHWFHSHTYTVTHLPQHPLLFKPPSAGTHALPANDNPVKRSILFTFVSLDFAKICAVRVPFGIAFKYPVANGIGPYLSCRLLGVHCTCYTVHCKKKGYRFSRPQTRYHLPTFPGSDQGVFGM